MQYVTYFRVSTQAQGRSGLGLEAQREAVKRFLTPQDVVVGSLTEVETGKTHDRPQLREAIALCRSRSAILLIAKLDRLSRSVAFISSLMECDVKFTACDMPDADPFRLHIEAAIAEEERRRISQRTRAALEAAKARGTILGGYRGKPPSDSARQASRESARQNRDQRQEALLREVRDLTYLTSLAAMQRALAQRGIVGKNKRPVSRRRLIEALAFLKSQST